MAETGQFVVEDGVGKRAALISVSDTRGAVLFEKFQEIVDFSVYMAKSGQAVPAFLRGNPGGCMAITIQATEWGFSPYAVARMAFIVNDQIAYLAQLLHAVVERRAPLKQRLRFDYEGEGPELRVIVTGHLKGEVEPLIYESPRFKDIKVKNSPLWQSDPKQQFGYYGARAWARRYVPDVLLGAYAADELDGIAVQHLGAENAKDVTPETEALHHRLSAKAAAGAGFDPSGIATTLNEATGKTATMDSSGASRIAPGAQAAASEPPTPVGIVETAADLSPSGDAPGNGGPAPETAAATPTAAAAVEPAKRRGRPPKAATAPAAEQTQDSATGADPAGEGAPAKTASDVTTESAPVVAVTEPEPQSSEEPAPQEVAPSAPTREAVADESAATAENSFDDDLPGDEAPGHVSDPQVDPLPETPRDGRYYPGWVRVMLRQQRVQSQEDPSLWWDMSVRDDVRKWWGSPSHKKLRNGLPNLTQDLFDRAFTIVKEYSATLKSENEGDQP